MGHGGDRTPVFGREGELLRLGRFVRDAESGGSTILIGGAGIGKTALWETAIDRARNRGMHVLSARPSGTVSEMPFGALIDLCDRLDDATLAVLSAPQRHALEVALMRAPPDGEPAPNSAVALGLLGVVRALADCHAVVIAIDDLQWLDRPSAEAVTFVARRLDGAPVTFLLARRPGPAGPLEAVLTRATSERLQIGPLSFGAVRRLLFERLGLTVSRQLLRRIVEMTDGNPLFALEVGRALADHGGSALYDDLPLPDSLDEILGKRVARLPFAIRRVLLAVALSEDPRTSQMLPILGARALDDAVDAGVVVVDGQRVRAAHPLLAAAAEARCGARERRELHLALSDAARDEPARTMHLALATQGVDGALAARVASAVDTALARGARREAAVLATQALRLTPGDAPERPARVIALAERLDDTGELRRMTALLRDELPSLPAGPMRGRAWLRLSEGEDISSMEDQDRYLERALSEGGEDRNLRAHVLAKRAGNAAAAAVAQLREAEAWAIEALELADDPMVQRYAMWSLAWPLGLGGRELDELCARSSVTTDPTAYISASPERVAAIRLVWRGELARARASLAALSELADARGDPTSYAMIRLHRIDLEVRAGELDVAAALLEEWAESSDYETQFRPQYPRCCALLEAQRGAGPEARHWAVKTIERGQAAGSGWDELEARRARGIGLLIEGAPEQALEDLVMVWDHCEREGVRDPGAFPVAPDLIEALVELDRLDDAQAVVRRLHEMTVEQDHPWARATGKRGTGLLALVVRDHPEDGAALLRETAVDLERVGLRLDSARCLLALGRGQRRLKQWRSARETLELAAAQFGALGADGWAARARSELDRVGGRRPATDGELTPSERRVIELAADGRSNKEIAAALYVTVNTVEVHLKRGYAKLGVRSRAQLVKRLADGV
ncbi:MAG TPA: AAA family ATPase [Solirubrobacteraceae bacterium]|nr:AAA family ATPase [Solirubrobacteraceae bacterium]